MKVRKQSEVGDYMFGNSAKDFLVNSPDAVGQIVKTSFLLFLGEWFLDTTRGTPIMQGILGKQSQAVADRTIRTRTLEAQGVTGITEYSSEIDPNTRKMSSQVTIDTLYGPTTVDLKNQVLF